VATLTGTPVPLAPPMAPVQPSDVPADDAPPAYTSGVEVAQAVIVMAPGMVADEAKGVVLRQRKTGRALVEDTGNLPPHCGPDGALWVVTVKCRVSKYLFKAGAMRGHLYGIMNHIKHSCGLTTQPNTTSAPDENL